MKELVVFTLLDGCVLGSLEILSRIVLVFETSVSILLAFFTTLLVWRPVLVRDMSLPTIRVRFLSLVEFWIDYVAFLSPVVMWVISAPAFLLSWLKKRFIFLWSFSFWDWLEWTVFALVGFEIPDFFLFCMAAAANILRDREEPDAKRVGLVSLVEFYRYSFIF